MNSVNQYVAGLLNDLPIPGFPMALTAQVTPPPQQAIAGPLAWVGGARMTGARESMPRGKGFKKLTWTMSVFLLLNTSPNPAANLPPVDQQFALIADAVMACLWSTEMPKNIEDPQTGFVTRVVSIGEQFTLDAPPVHTDKPQRQLIYTARINFQVQELPQA